MVKLIPTIAEPDYIIHFGYAKYYVYAQSTLESLGLTRNMNAGVVFTHCVKCESYTYKLVYSLPVEDARHSGIVYMCEECLTHQGENKLIIWER